MPNRPRGKIGKNLLGTSQAKAAMGYVCEADTFKPLILDQLERQLHMSREGEPRILPGVSEDDLFWQ